MHVFITYRKKSTFFKVLGAKHLFLKNKKKQGTTTICSKKSTEYQTFWLSLQKHCIGMKRKYLIKKTCTLLLTAALCGTACTASASPITQIGDRYIINVRELELQGDESLADLLMMCPDVMTLDGKTVLTSDPLANLYGRYALRIDNVDYGLDGSTFLHNLKAREIEKIQICTNSEVMKGAGSMKKVIDIQLRDGEGVSGRAGLFGDTYGKGEAIGSVRYDSDNLTILSHIEGSIQRTAFDPMAEKTSYAQHRRHEGAKVSADWDITKKDNLCFYATQTNTRQWTSGFPADKEHSFDAEADYTRTFSDNGASVTVLAGISHLVNNGGVVDEASGLLGYRNRLTYPYGLTEFYFPLFTKDLWITAGIEAGLSMEEDCVEEYTNRSNYQDLYVQADWTVGKWSFTLGDRFRTINFRQSEIKEKDPYEHSTHNHAYTASVIYQITPSQAIQGTFSRRFFDADFSNFITMGSGEDDTEGEKEYLSDYPGRFAYVSELRHHISTKSFMLNTVVRNIHQDTWANGKDNTLGVGTTAFWHTGPLRLTAGANYFWEKNRNVEDTSYSHFAVMKLAPQLTLPSEWRLTSTLIWSTRRPFSSPVYTPANLYAELSAYKRFGKHWLVEARYHDIAGQHWGNRAVTGGCTYYF